MPNDQPDWVSPTSQVQKVLGFLNPAANTQVSQSFAVPTEAQALGFLVDTSGGVFFPVNLTLVGDQSQNFYFNTVTPQGGVNLEHRSLVDTSVTFTVKSPVAGAAKVWLFCWTAHPVVSIENVRTNPLTVDVTDRAGRVLGDIVDRLNRQLGRVVNVDTLNNAVSVAQDLGGNFRLATYRTVPATWEVPNLSAGYSTGSLAGNGTITILAGGGAGVRTRLFKVTVNVQAYANGFGMIECPSGTIVAQWNAIVSNTQEYSFEGLDCGLNAGVVLRNGAAGATGFIQGHALVNQT